MSATETGSSGSNASNELQLNIKGMLKLDNQGRYLIDALPGPSELKLQIAIDANKTVKDLKEAIAKNSDVEAERQRLIYSGILSPSLPLILF
jgi:hypothetical protein